MRTTLIILSLIPAVLWGQDYTFSTSQTAVPSLDAGRNTLLVMPYHEHYHISEVDRILSQSPEEAALMREQLRRKLNQRICRAFSDSLETMDLSIAGMDEEINLLNYLYNSVDYRLDNLQAEERKKKKGFFKLPERKKKEVFGFKSQTKEGQIQREEIWVEQYMSVFVQNLGAIDYVQSHHPFQFLLFLNQLEIRRDIEQPGQYQLSVHYTLMNRQGKRIRGNKRSQPLLREEVHMQYVSKTVFEELAQAILVDLWPTMGEYMPLQETESNANSDY